MQWWQGVLVILGFVAAGLIIGLSIGRLIITRRSRSSLTPLVIGQSRPVNVYRPAKAGFMGELISNLEIASSPWNGELKPFETNGWDADRNGYSTMPPATKENLSQAYVDIRLANNIVWLSKELGRRTGDLDESYRRLCNRIAIRLREAIDNQSQGMPQA